MACAKTDDDFSDSDIKMSVSDIDHPISPEFKEWLSDLGQTFQRLSTQDRNRTLDFLVSISDGSQLFHLSEKLSKGYKLDFLTLLPQDVVFHMVGFFGAETMKTCCLVSSRWNTIIHSCSRAWKAAALAQGANLDGHMYRKAKDFKELYLAATWYKNKLKAGTALDMSPLYGHRDRIMTVYYKNNIIATGSDDRTVKLWKSTTGECYRTLATNTTIAAVKFDDVRVVTASFNTKAMLWDLKTGHAVVEYVGHVAAVFSIDYDAELDLLVTGSADSMVKVWTMSTGELVRSLTHHRDTWITQVCLHWTPAQDAYSVLCCDDSVIYMWRLSRSRHNVISSQQLTDPETSVLLPGWQVHGSVMTYVTFIAPSEYQVTHLDLRQPNTPSSVIKFILHDLIPQGFLGSGRQFTVLLHAVDGERSEMTVVQNTSGKIIATIPMPTNFRSSKRGASFTLGDREWLDGFTSCSLLGRLLGACVCDIGIIQLRWRSLPYRPQDDHEQ